MSLSPNSLSDLIVPYHHTPLITLYRGDALTLAQADSTPIDTILTDPPYFQLCNYEEDDQWGWEKTISEYSNKIVNLCRPLRSRLREGGVFWLIIGDTSNVPSAIRAQGERRAPTVKHRRKMQPEYLEKEAMQVPWRLMNALRDDGWWCRREHIWDKGTSGQQKNSDVAPLTHAYIFPLFKWSKRGRPYLKCKPLNRTVLYYPTVSIKGHPCPLPPGLVRELLTASNNPGDRIIDPFAGSGQTLLTAADMGIHSIGYELSAKYCKLIASRDLANPKTEQPSLFQEVPA